MKVVRVFAVAIAVGALALAVGADDKKADNAKMILGAWEVTKADKDSLPVGAVSDFSKDGKVKVTMKKDGKEETHEGTYKVDGDKLTITFKDDKGGEKKLDITIKKCSDTECVTESDGKTIEWKKKK
jgi:uncharacterized protein (TIGR03066 family)